jgi:predicted RNA-binding protein YlxR (DUF448 family)
MTRGGRNKDREDGPERKCIATGETAQGASSASWSGRTERSCRISLGKLPGRGIWVAPTATR